MNPFEHSFRTVWLWSLSLFILAAFTGFLFRLGMNIPLPFDLVLPNVRHAHSHLMFFSWVTPVPMAFIARYVVNQAPQAAGRFRTCIYTVMALGFAAFPFFLMNGYRPVSLGDAQLPLSVIFSGLVMIGWYWFIIIYLKHRRCIRPSLPSFFYDGALIMLAVSSLGAWGVAVFQFSNVDNPMFSTALTHFFLTTFTEGWCILSALGIIADVNNIQTTPFSGSWLIAPIVLGVPLMFPFGMSPGLLTSTLLVSARAGAFLVAAGLTLNLFVLSRQIKTNLWIFILILLGIKTLMQFGSSILPSSIWMGEHGLRILYLHLLLLGFASLTFFTGWHQRYSSVSHTGLFLLYASVVILLLSLVMLSGFWPSFLIPGNLLVVITTIAILPVFASIWEWIIQFRHNIT